jgi:transposase
VAQIFAGSKATISECVNETEAAWQLFQQDIEKPKQIEDEARKQLIEEAKQRMKEQEQPNERTAVLHSGEDDTP